MTSTIIFSEEELYSEETVLSEFVKIRNISSVSSNFPDIEFKDDDQNPSFYAKLQYTGGGMLAAGFLVGVRWTSGTKEKIVNYRLPNAYGWAARTIRKQGSNGVAFSATDLGSPRGGSILKDLVVFSSGENYGVWNGTNYNVFLIWESVDNAGGGGFYLRARHRAFMYTGDIRILYGEVEPN